MQVLAPATDEKLERQAVKLHRVASELLQHYQFRSRNEICCHGVSVSQCHVLEALGEKGPLSMGELARRQRVTVSTMTRVVDGLVERGLVARHDDPDDRRICRAALTDAGAKLVGLITDEMVAREREILARIPPDHRESLIFALEQFAGIVRACCEGACQSPTTEVSNG